MKFDTDKIYSRNTKLFLYPFLFFLLISISGMAQNGEDNAEIIDEKEGQENKLKKIIKNFTFGGSADVYFRQNLTGPNGSDAIAPNTSFANLNGFAIGMANIILTYEGKKVGGVVDLVFGPRGTDAVFGSLQWDIDGDGTPDLGNSSQIVNQLYVYWNISDKVTLTFGNFNTFLGYELISPVGNFNYSTSYMFSYGPFSHTGLKLGYAINDDWSLLFAIMNENDFTTFNPTNNYTFGAQIGYDGIYLNFLYGNQFQVDLTTGFDLTSSWYLGVNSTYYKRNNEDGSYYGVALYPQFKPNDKWGIGLRAEFFAEDNGGVGAIGEYNDDGFASVFEFTLTGNYAIGDLMLIPEIRLDAASENTFLTPDLDPSNSLASFLIAAVYKF